MDTESRLRGVARHVACGFAIGTKGMLGNPVHVAVFTMIFWQWDQSNQYMDTDCKLSGAGGAYNTAFAIGCKGFVGLGLMPTAPLTTRICWEFYDDANAAYCMDARNK